MFGFEIPYLAVKLHILASFLGDREPRRSKFGLWFYVWPLRSIKLSFKFHIWPFFLGDRGRRRSKFVLYRRPKANGVVKSRNYKVNEAKNSQAVLNVQQHSISYTLSKNKAVIEEYTHSDHTDLFQVFITLIF